MRAGAREEWAMANGWKAAMSAADWDLIERANVNYQKPTRDIVAADGQKLTLGDTTVTLYVTPERPARFWFSQHASSAQRFRDAATRPDADVVLSNRTNLDGSKTKLPSLRTRAAGAPHPCVVGKDAVRRYLTVADECAQAGLPSLPR
jgi:metallo-beta-lactamase class B